MTFRLILTVLFVLVGCASSPKYPDPFTFPQIGWTPGLLLAPDQADRVLGTASHLEKTTSYRNGDVRTYQSVYYDDAPDAAQKTGTLYYMLEEYPTAEAAKTYLDGTLKDNRLPLDGESVGAAQLHYLTGGRVVRMAMILKENRLLRLKVNVVTARYSLPEFQKVAVEMAKAM